MNVVQRAQRVAHAPVLEMLPGWHLWASLSSTLLLLSITAQPCSTLLLLEEQQWDGWRVNPTESSKGQTAAPTPPFSSLSHRRFGRTFCRNQRSTEAFRTASPLQPTSWPQRLLSPQEQAQLVPASSCIASPATGRGEVVCGQPHATTTPAWPKALPAALFVTRCNWLR